MSIDTRISDLEERVQNLELRHGVQPPHKEEDASESTETKLRTFPEVFRHLHSLIDLFSQ